MPETYVLHREKKGNPTWGVNLPQRMIPALCMHDFGPQYACIVPSPETDVFPIRSLIEFLLRGRLRAYIIMLRKPAPKELCSRADKLEFSPMEATVREKQSFYIPPNMAQPSIPLDISSEKGAPPPFHWIFPVNPPPVGGH